MNNCYRLIYRSHRGGMFYCVDKTTGKTPQPPDRKKAETQQVIVARNQAERQALRSNQLLQHHDDTVTTDAVINPKGWALAGEVIHDGQRVESAAIGQLGVD